MKLTKPCFFVLDMCKDVKCEFNSKCITKYDRTTQCVCSKCPYDDTYAPVCGDDGRSYATLCQLKYQSCLLKKEISVVDYGTCGMFFFSVFTYRCWL